MRIKRESGEVIDLTIFNSKLCPQIRTSVYLLKYLPGGEVRAYDRGYGYIGIVLDRSDIQPSKFVVQTWPDYGGGVDGLVGNGVWLDSAGRSSRRR